MRLKVKGEDIDLRDQLGHERRVIDEDTGKSVGVIVSRQGWGDQVILLCSAVPPTMSIRFCVAPSRAISRLSSRPINLVINLTTAKALGLTIPESFLLRVDEVIE
jgi:hypothetical protein